MAHPTTDELGCAIRDAIELLDGVEIEASDQSIPVDFIGADDPSNLEVIVGGAVFVVRIVRKD